jgi:hypothetical protein
MLLFRITRTAHRLATLSRKAVWVAVHFKAVRN